MTTKARLSSICIGTVLAIALAGCGGSTASSAGTASAPAPTSSPGASDSSSGFGQPAAQKPAMQKVSANTASEEEIDAALRSAGVSNSGRWADEVVEYRPYPADDPNLSKLRENLAKYNPGQDTTDKIVSVLTP